MAHLVKLTGDKKSNEQPEDDESVDMQEDSATADSKGQEARESDDNMEGDASSDEATEQQGQAGADGDTEDSHSTSGDTVVDEKNGHADSGDGKDDDDDSDDEEGTDDDDDSDESDDGDENDENMEPSGKKLQLIPCRRLTINLGIVHSATSRQRQAAGSTAVAIVQPLLSYRPAARASTAATDAKACHGLHAK